MNKGNECNRFRQAIRCLSPPVYEQLIRHENILKDSAQEIRLRLNRPVSAICADSTYFFKTNGQLSINSEDKLLSASKEDIEKTFHKLCDYSVYSRQNEIVQGFVTLSGGHRAGICGTAVFDKDQIINIRNITSINIRIAKEYKGCADKLYQNLDRSKGVLICGAPCTGKTTMLRDLARLISLKENKRVSLIDERGELAGTSNGFFQNDIGLCDVFDSYPKSVAVLQAIRSMSPDVVVCDEIGSALDIDAIINCANCGASVIASVHAADIDELMRKENILKALRKDIFPQVVFLSPRSRAGQIAKICKAGEILDN